MANKDKVLKNPSITKIVPHLRQLCSEGEYNLEAHWAEKIIRLETKEEYTYAIIPFYGFFSLSLLRDLLTSKSNSKRDAAQFYILRQLRGPDPSGNECDNIHELKRNAMQIRHPWLGSAPRCASCKR